MAKDVGLEREMRDNLEHLQGVGESKEITGHPSYAPTQRIGPENDFSRDFHSDGAKRNVSHGGTLLAAPKDSLPLGMQDAITSTVTDPNAPAAPLQHVIDAPANNIATSQVVCGTVPTRLVYASPNRLTVILNNRDQTNAIFIGSGSSLTVNTGFSVDPGASMTMAINCEIWAVCATGTPLMSIIEFLE